MIVIISYGDTGHLYIFFHDLYLFQKYFIQFKALSYE